MVTTQLDAADMLRMVAAAFGVPSKGLQKSDLLLALEAHFVAVTSAGKRCLMIVDEAQNLSPAAIEELRMLSNFQLETHALLQSFLIGQPEFRITLQGPSMEQLRQRVIATAHIGAMGETETQDYIEHRLRHVGWSGVPDFDDDAFRAIHEHTAGVPRRINSLCDRLMWYGYLSEKRHFKRSDVLEVADELKEEVRPSRLSDGAPVQQSSPTVLPFATRGDAKPVPTISPEMQAAMVAHLKSIDEGIQQLDLTMQRVERSNLLNSTSFKRLLEWIQARETGARDTGT
jgi:hypothetical protein